MWPRLLLLLLAHAAAASAARFQFTGSSSVTATEIDVVQTGYDYGDAVRLGNFSISVAEPDSGATLQAPPGYQVVAESAVSGVDDDVVLRSSWVFQSTSQADSLSAHFVVQDGRDPLPDEATSRNATVVCQECAQPFDSCGASCSYSSSFSDGHTYGCTLTPSGSDSSVYSGTVTDPTGRQVLSVYFNIQVATLELTLSEIFDEIHVEASMVMIPPAGPSAASSSQIFASSLEWRGSPQFSFRLSENSSGGSPSHAGVIAGVVICLIAVIAIGGGCWYWRRSSKNDGEDDRRRFDVQSSAYSSMV